ncbi:MAG: MOSC domain-containing protein [Salibacteraceae bacterium]
MKMPNEQCGKVQSVSKCASHNLGKNKTESILLLKGLGVEGDAHLGKTVKHLYLEKKDPSKPNLRQVHLMHTELFEELKNKGFEVRAAEMGENITTSGIDLLSLPKGTVLSFGPQAKIEVTGLRNPCNQLEAIQKGLMKAVLDRDEAGNLIRKAGIMAIVVASGRVNVGDKIEIHFPKKPYLPLEPV